MAMTSRDDAPLGAQLPVRVDRPVRDEGPVAMEWGSDALAEALRSLDVPFIAINPGASYRGLHDSIVNYLGNERPAMLVCLHEEHAVAIAHGYAKVTGAPMAVAVHSNVGLMHGTMAIYNAFADRVPLILIGAQGPLDSAQRRPWIDWMHSTADPAAMIRHFIKWDDAPASVAAALLSLTRANRIARTYPQGPTFVNLDVGLQEQRLHGAPRFPDLTRTLPPAPPGPSRAQVEQVTALLTASPRTVMLIGRGGAGEDAWRARIGLAEALGAQVITDTKQRAVFPTADDHHAAVPAALLTDSGAAVLRDATMLLSLDWVDLEGTLRMAFDGPAPVSVVHCSMDHTLHNGWSKDHFEMPEVDVFIAADPDALITELLSVGVSGPSPGDAWGIELPADAAPPSPGPAITIRQLAAALRRVTASDAVSLLRVPLGWDGRDLDIRHPLDHMGYDGGAGIGSGPGMAVGAALALIGGGRLPVAVLGDGDFLMGCSALWTAARHRIPVLVIVANNRSFYNDEMHQERIARQRSRPIENRWIGQHLRDPEPDLAAIANGMGLMGYGPISSRDDLAGVIADGVEVVRSGGCAVIDVHVEANDYVVQPAAAVEQRVESVR
jgi:thiamine pyrophosphate-dependent acetolactate synthase large subunit-like protein